MSLIFLFISLILPTYTIAQSLPVKIAVMDTALSSIEGIPFCQEGYKDVIIEESDTVAKHLHGSQIVKTIVDSLKQYEGMYCLAVFNLSTRKHTVSSKAIVSTLKYIKESNFNFHIINMSYEGEERLNNEYLYIKSLSFSGKLILAAAGNSGIELSDTTCNIYPACYREVKAIGCQGFNGCKGNRDLRNNILGNYDGPACIRNFCGTSVSAAWMSAEFAKIIIAFSKWRDA